MTDSAKRATKRLGLENSAGEVRLTRESLLEGIGGWLGVTETITPTALFAVSFAVAQDVATSVWLAASSAAIFILIRLFRRQSLIQPLAGLIGVAISVFLALRDGGSGADYFVLGFFTNSLFAAGLIISIIFRYPLLGFLGGLVFGIADWREDPSLRTKFTRITWIWVAFFSLRLVVQVPLYLAQEIALLAASRLVMGLPAYAALLVLTWVLLRGVAKSAPRV